MREEFTPKFRDQMVAAIGFYWANPRGAQVINTKTNFCLSLEIT